MDGVGGGVPVGHHDAAFLIEPAPVLLVGGEAVHGVQHRRGVGVHVPGPVAQGSVEVEVRRFGKGVAIPGKVDLPICDAPLGQGLAQELCLGGLARSVRALEYDQFSVHLRLFSCLTWIRNSGSFIIRPMRRGSLHRR